MNGALCLHHGTECNHLDEIILWFSFAIRHQLVETSCCSALRTLCFHLISKLHNEFTQGFQLLWVRIVVNTIRKRLWLLSFLYLSDTFCHRTVGEKHEFLDEFIGILRALVVAAYWFPLFVNVEMQLFAVKLNSTIFESCGTQFLSQSVKRNELKCVFSLIRMFLCFGWSRFASTINHTICFEEFLYLFIFISAVALYDGMYDAIVLDFGIVVEFEDDAVRKFFLIRTKRADKVTETLWEHRDGAIYEIYRCCTFHSFLVDDAALCDVM